MLGAFPATGAAVAEDAALAASGSGAARAVDVDGDDGALALDAQPPPATTMPSAAASRGRELAVTRPRTFTPSWYHAPGSRAPIVLNLRFCLALALVSCTPEALPPRPPAPPSRPAPAPDPWSRFEEISAWPSVGAPFANLGHPGAGELATVRVSPDARLGYETLVSDSVLPEGTLVALFHAERTGHAGAVYVMEKRGSTWSYLVLTSRGVAVEGANGQCAGCHENAVGDRLFGLPRPKGSAP